MRLFSLSLFLSSSRLYWLTKWIHSIDPLYHLFLSCEKDEKEMRERTNERTKSSLIIWTKKKKWNVMSIKQKSIEAYRWLNRSKTISLRLSIPSGINSFNHQLLIVATKSMTIWAIAIDPNEWAHHEFVCHFATTVERKKKTRFCFRRSKQMSSISCDQKKVRKITDNERNHLWIEYSSPVASHYEQQIITHVVCSSSVNNDQLVRVRW